MRIEWDEHKRRLNIEKHGLDFADLTLEFFESALIEHAAEKRLRAIGALGEGSIVTVIFRPLGTEALSIISVRRASKAERSRR